MTTVSDIAKWLEMIAPGQLSADWDNTGLLLGDAEADVRTVLTCLTLTDVVVAEAVETQTNLVVSHHPIPFRPIKSITTAEDTGRRLWQLAINRISVYSPHTRWDSASDGINAQIAQKLELQNVRPIIPIPIEGIGDSQVDVGVGRIGELTTPLKLSDVVRKTCAAIPYCRPRGVDSGKTIRNIAIVCGSGGSLISSLREGQCDLFITGEATFHQCLEAQSKGIAMLMIGHFASEKFAMHYLAGMMQGAFSELVVFGSTRETDPVTNW